MAEHISREAIKQVLYGIANGLSVGETEALKTKDVKALYKIKGAKEILNAIDNDLSFISAADVQLVKHGRWIIKGQEIYCSECDTESSYNSFGASQFTRFCPNCGARMIKDGEIDE